MNNYKIDFLSSVWIRITQCYVSSRVKVKHPLPVVVTVALQPQGGHSSLPFHLLIHSLSSTSSVSPLLQKLSPWSLSTRACKFFFASLFPLFNRSLSPPCLITSEPFHEMLSWFQFHSSSNSTFFKVECFQVSPWCPTHIMGSNTALMVTYTIPTPFDLPTHYSPSSFSIPLSCHFLCLSNLFLLQCTKPPQSPSGFHKKVNFSVILPLHHPSFLSTFKSPWTDKTSWIKLFSDYTAPCMLIVLHI